MHQLGRGAVELVGDPADGGLHGGVGRVGHVVVAPHVAVEAADLDVVDAVFRGPEALLVGQEERAVVVQADPVGGAEAGGEDVGAEAVAAHTKQRPVLRDERGLAVAGGLGVIEIPVRVGLQVHRELVEVLGHLVVAVEVLIKVGLAVAVEVAEDHDLVAAGDEDLPVADLQAERLEQSRRDPPPRELARPASSPLTSQTSPSQVQTAA